MIKVTVIATGRLKEKFFTEAAEEYTKRLSKYCELNIIEINEKQPVSAPSQKEIEIQLKKEAQLIALKIPKNSAVIPLCIEGKELSSEDLAEKISDFENSGKNICFIIGGSWGMSEELKKLADFKLSFSRMTFPHKLFRVMLLEQIYRAFKINEGSKYHK